MVGIHYFKAEPTEYARITVGGKVKEEGKGISRLYIPFRTSVELVPTSSIDQPFAFDEVTLNKQPVSLQGGFVYVVTKPAQVVQKYNFAIDPVTKRYLSDDAKKLPDHIVRIVQASARKIVQGKNLEELLVMSDVLSRTVSEEVCKSPQVEELGVNVEMLYFTAITPPPHIAKALEAEYRENLLKKADEATYKRRAAAVEQEKTIQTNEMSNRIDLEKKREELVTLEGNNAKKEAEAKADAQKQLLEAFGTMDAEAIRAHALYQLGANASRIESLTITPELLAGFNGALRGGQ